MYPVPSFKPEYRNPSTLLLGGRIISNAMLPYQTDSVSHHLCEKIKSFEKLIKRTFIIFVLLANTNISFLCLFSFIKIFLFML